MILFFAFLFIVIIELMKQTEWFFRIVYCGFYWKRGTQVSFVTWYAIGIYNWMIMRCFFNREVTLSYSKWLRITYLVEESVLLWCIVLVHSERRLSIWGFEEVFNSQCSGCNNDELCLYDICQCYVKCTQDCIKPDDS